MSTPSQIVTSPAGRHSSLIDFFERVPFMAGAVVAIMGALVLAGWALNLPIVTQLSQGGVPMIPLTALSFALAGGSLTMAVRPNRTPTTEAIQQTLAAAVATIAVLTFYEYVRGGPSQFDSLLFGDRLHDGSVSPGRIAPNTAACLLLFALALLSIPHDQRKHDLRAQMFAAPGLFIALVAILGYVFDVRGMYSLSQSSGMALPTAIAHLILGVGIIFAVRDRGVASLLMDEGAAGLLTRRLLPAALLAPVVLGIVRLAGESAGIYETEFGTSLFALASILIYVVLVLWSARVLRNSDKERVDLLALEQQARAHAERARAEAETARAEAERANNSKTDFLAVMSHELRTPLTAIMGYEELLSDGITGPVTELQRQQLGRINASARHLLGLIDEILTFARVDIGRERVRWESMSVNHTLNDAASLVQPMAADKKLKFVVELLNEDQSIQTDSTKLRQMLVNLLSNGIKFTDKGEVRLGCAVNSSTLEVRIADTGVGIAAENIEDVFEPFWQAEQTATRKTGGTGLGLSVTRKLARLLGGDVTVASRMGAGTTFLLTLPMKAPVGETVKRRDTPSTPTNPLQAVRI
ncbi:MAG TPA: HAMP domain-containing sensor histidine kinase [Gemmatimonadaceae bacterium]|jgi:signal transduction histidine kinase|nr:HAMP domain-containing sensor histidine kinase [Gemmatimonadaceae bacterium]